MDRLNNLIVFGQIVESGGLSAAGRRLHLSTTMISNHLKALESRLGVRLLNRSTRHLSLTEAGQFYYQRSRQILADIDEADQLAAAGSYTPRGPLKIYATSTVAAQLIGLIADFENLYPSIAVQFDVGDDAMDPGDEGYDLAVVVAKKNSPHATRKLGSLSHVLVASPGYLKRFSSAALNRPSDLRAHACLHDRSYPYGTTWRFETKTRQRSEVVINPAFTSNDLQCVRLLAIAGGGLMFAPTFSVVEDLERGDLIRVMPNYRGPELSLDVVVPGGTNSSARVSTVIEILADHFAELKDAVG